MGGNNLINIKRSTYIQLYFSITLNFRSRLLWSLIYCVLFLITSSVVASDHEQKWILNSNVIQGASSSELRTALSDVVVQRLLLDIALKPRKKEYLNSALQKTNVSPEQLLGLKLIRCQGDNYIINFLLFTKADMYRMREITESHAKVLANAFLKRRSEIETIIKQYKLPGVDSRTALYIILGCFSLDWDGLALTAERGYRQNESQDARTVVYSWESTKLSKKEFYKGSHNSSYGIATLTSFGDHEIQPREALPDILWKLPRQAAQGRYPDTLKLKIQKVVEASVEALGERLGLMMLALRNGRNSLAELAEAACIRQDNAERLIDLLIELGYIKQNDNYYLSRIPVLSLCDSSIVQQIRRIGREEMENWFDCKYEQLHKELSELTPFRYGVKQTDFFYEIWHDIFGATNRILVNAGLFTDPYSKLYGAKGIIPVVFNSSLYEKP